MGRKDERRNKDMTDEKRENKMKGEIKRGK